MEKTLGDGEKKCCIAIVPNLSGLVDWWGGEGMVPPKQHMELYLHDHELAQVELPATCAAQFQTGYGLIGPVSWRPLLYRE